MTKMISTRLAEICNIEFGEDDLPEFKFLQMGRLRRLIDLADIIGWEEHTSDWDLYLMVELKDGTKIESTRGYPDYKVEWGKLRFNTDDELQEEARIHLADIKSITLDW